jgi:hypothetical protein
MVPSLAWHSMTERSVASPLCERRAYQMVGAEQQKENAQRVIARTAAMNPLHSPFAKQK